MDDPSLLDCLRYNVNYSTQMAAFNWRDTYGRSPVTFDDYIKAFSEYNAKIAQLKYR